MPSIAGWKLLYAVVSAVLLSLLATMVLGAMVEHADPWWLAERSTAVGVVAT